MGRFAARNGFADYEALQRWSVTDLEGFWQAVWDFYAIRRTRRPSAVLGRARHAGRASGSRARRSTTPSTCCTPSDAVAVVGARRRVSSPSTELREAGRARARGTAGARRRAGRPRRRLPAEPPRDADRVPGHAPASARSGPASRPSSAPRSVIDRFAQIEPKVLLAVDGYTHRGEWIDRGAELAGDPRGLPTLEHVLHRAAVRAAASSRSTRCRSTTRSTCSSRPGTTGLPKPIVHGHGGILLEHVKNLGLGWDLKPGARLLLLRPRPRG